MRAMRSSSLGHAYRVTTGNRRTPLRERTTWLSSRRWATGSWRPTSRVTPVHPDAPRVDVLVVPEAGQEGGHERFDHEDAVGRQVRGDVREAAHLLLLRQQVEQGVEHEVDQAVGARDRHVGEVAQRDGEPLPARLRPQPGDHGRREVDAVDPDAAGRERQRDAPRSHRKLQRRPPVRQLREQRHRRRLVAAHHVLVRCRGVIPKAVDRFVAVHPSKHAHGTPPNARPRAGGGGDDPLTTGRHHRTLARTTSRSHPTYSGRIRANLSREARHRSNRRV